MQFLNRILPQRVVDALASVDFKFLQEVRLRVDKPAALLFNGKKCFVGKSGICLLGENAFIVSKAELENTLMKACEYSMHSYSEQMTQGFLMPIGGLRIGICGSGVMNGGKIVSFKDFSSINIRIPREVKNCSKAVSDELLNPLKNVLIVARPGAGKTTFLRDLIFQSSLLFSPPNVLVADERNEITGNIEGVMQFDLGNFCDSISLTTKEFAFESGIRTMAPDVIACDEICSADLASIEKISNNGVKIFATIHAENIDEVKRKTEFCLLNKIFDRYVVLTDKRKIGDIEGLYTNELIRIIL